MDLHEQQSAQSLFQTIYCVATGGITIKQSNLFKCCASMLLCILLFSGCAPETPRNVLFYQYFNTIIDLSARGMSASKFDAFQNEAEKQLQYYHCLFDQYHTYEGLNNLKTINDSGLNHPVTVDTPLISLLARSIDYCTASSGKVDISQGAVLRLWQAARDNEKLPPPMALLEAQQHSGIETILLDETKGTVTLSKEGVSLDLGAVAKGYAIEETAKALKALGYDHFILNGGGNVKAVGTPGKAGSLWSLGLKSPEKGNGDLLLTLQTPPVSMVTSGNYQRYVTIEGKDYGHIIDPQTGYPAQNFLSVTILCNDSGIADMLSTALFLLDRPTGEALLSRYDAKAIWVSTEGELTYSLGLENQITLHKI